MGGCFTEPGHKLDKGTTNSATYHARVCYRVGPWARPLRRKQLKAAGGQPQCRLTSKTADITAREEIEKGKKKIHKHNHPSETSYKKLNYQQASISTCSIQPGHQEQNANTTLFQCHIKECGCKHYQDANNK